MSWLLYYFAIELIHISLKWRRKLKLSLKKRYLFLTEFEVCTLNYRPNFFRSDIWPKRAGHKSERKNSGDRENEFSKIFILSLGLNNSIFEKSRFRRLFLPLPDALNVESWFEKVSLCMARLTVPNSVKWLVTYVIHICPIVSSFHLVWESNECAWYLDLQGTSSAFLVKRAGRCKYFHHCFKSY